LTYECFYYFANQKNDQNRSNHESVKKVEIVIEWVHEHFIYKKGGSLNLHTGGSTIEGKVVTVGKGKHPGKGGGGPITRTDGRIGVQIDGTVGVQTDGTGGRGVVLMNLGIPPYGLKPGAIHETREPKAIG